MSDYKRLEYNNLNHALEDLNARDMGRYFLCDCPSCQHHEAFMYKGTNFLNCNRENECGEKFVLRYREKSKHQYKGEYRKKQDRSQEKTQLSAQQSKERQWATRFLNFVKNNTNNELDGFRGLSSETCSNFIANLHHEKMVKYFFENTKSLFKKDYTKLNFITKRNLFMPIYDEDGQVDRILMRSTIDNNLGQKEVQLVLNPNAENDYFIDVKPEHEFVCVTEGPIDGFSYREVKPDIGVMAQSGSRKVNSLQNYIRNHKEKFSNKTFILSFDQDRAGRIARYKWIEFLKEENLRFTEMIGFPENIKDANDWLQKDRDEFKQTLENVISDYNSLLIIDKEKWIIEKIHAPKDDIDHKYYRLYTRDMVIGNVKVHKQTNEVTPPIGTDTGERIRFSPFLKNAISKISHEVIPYYQKCPLFIKNVDLKKIKDNKVYSYEEINNKERYITFQKDHVIFERIPFAETSKGEKMMFIQNAWILTTTEEKIFESLKQKQEKEAVPVTVKNKAENKNLEYERV